MSIGEIGKTLSEKHGWVLSHRESVPVKETFNGQTVWDGIVEVFNLHGHSQTDRLYAWFHDTGEEHKLVTVLHVHPALTPADAVRAFIFQEYRNANA